MLGHRIDSKSGVSKSWFMASAKGFIRWTWIKVCTRVVSNNTWQEIPFGLEFLPCNGHMDIIVVGRNMNMTNWKEGDMNGSVARGHLGRWRRTVLLMGQEPMPHCYKLICNSRHKPLQFLVCTSALVSTILILVPMPEKHGTCQSSKLLHRAWFTTSDVQAVRKWPIFITELCNKYQSDGMRQLNSIPQHCQNW